MEAELSRGGICYAKWDDAKRICSNMNAALPTLDELKGMSWTVVVESLMIIICIKMILLSSLVPKRMDLSFPATIGLLPRGKSMDILWQFDLRMAMII